MSRSCYSDGLDQWDLIRWRGAVKSALRGKRGQAFLREMLEALDALPEPRLVSGELVAEGDVCALGSVTTRRGMDVSDLGPLEDPEDTNLELSRRLGIAQAMVAEVEWINDEAGPYGRPETPEGRFRRVREWVAEHIQTSEEAP